MVLFCIHSMEWYPRGTLNTEHGTSTVFIRLYKAWPARVSALRAISSQAPCSQAEMQWAYSAYSDYDQVYQWEMSSSDDCVLRTNPPCRATAVVGGGRRVVYSQAT